MKMIMVAKTFGLLLLVASAASVTQAGQSEQPAFTRELYYRWSKELSNWGRWGKEDQLGTINLITPAKRKQAAALVKEGVSVSLAELQIPNVVDPGSPYSGKPYTMTLTFREGYAPATQDWAAAPAEELTLGAHGGRSHIDALAHTFYKGQYYNGLSYKEVTEKGAAKGDIHILRHGIVTRGVLMDIPRLKGVSYLQKNERVYVRDLEAWEKKTGVRVQSGDALFIRVGHWARRKATGDRTDGNAGLDPSVIPWLKARDVAVMGSETFHDVFPNEYNGGPGARLGVPVVPGDIPWNTLHYFVQIFLGMPLFDFLDMDALGDMAAKYNRWEFQVIAAPLPVVGGSGSPINPIAVF